MSLSSRLAGAPRARLLHGALLLPLTAALVLTGMPANAATDATITGTVTFQETDPDRSVEVFREQAGAWTEDEARQTEAAQDGSYVVHAPAGEPVKIRVSYGSHEYGYWYGDGFGAVTAAAVQAGAGRTLSGVDLDVPAPAYVSGRVTNRAGRGIPAMVVPSINNDGGLRPTTDGPIGTSASGEYTVVLPAQHETSVMGLSQDGNVWAWLTGGSLAEPNFYTNLSPFENRRLDDIVLPLGEPSSSATPTPSTGTRLTATGLPVVRGAARRGAVLRATRGRWNLAPTTFRFQWLRNGAVIRGATRSVYRLHRADVRKRVSVRVTASRTGVRAPATVHSTSTPRVKRR